MRKFCYFCKEVYLGGAGKFIQTSVAEAISRDVQ